MATSRDDLKNDFSDGKKPTGQQFQELLDAYVHKAEDGLTLDDEGNLGVGIETPEARLHVDGGLKIGDVTADLAQIAPGTLQWTGSKLQVFFAGKWENIWSGDAILTTKSLLSDLKNKKVTAQKEETISDLKFPDKAIQLLKVEFKFDYTKVAPKINDKHLKIKIISPVNGEVIFTVSYSPSVGTKTDQIVSTIVTGNKSIENLGKFILQLSVTGTRGELTVTMKNIIVICQVRP